MFKDIFEFTNFVDTMDDCLDIYDKKRLEDTRFTLYLSNGKKIQIHYPLNSIPHLLGIDIDFLRSTDIYKGNSWEILIDILDNPNKLYNQIKNGHINPEQVFSKYTNDKLDNFENICGINIFDIEFISHYDKEKSYTSGVDPLEGEYYIGFRNNAKTLSIVGFTENNGIYAPMTNLKFDYYSDEKEKFLKRLLNNQTLLQAQTLRKNTLINGSIDQKKFFYPLEEREKNLVLMERYTDEYNATCDTHTDYIYYIRKTINLHEEKNTIWDILTEITEAIKERKMINMPKLEKKYGEMKTSFIKAISAYNDSLVNNQTSNLSSENSQTYEDIIEEFKKSKQEVERLNELIVSIDSENKKLVERNLVLEEENTELKDKHDKIRTILGK